MNFHELNGAALNGYDINNPYVSPQTRASYNLVAGVNNLRPKLRGTSMCIVLENKGNGGNWAVEGVRGTSRDAGRRR